MSTSTITGGFTGCVSKGDVVVITDSSGNSQTVVVKEAHASYFEIRELRWYDHALAAVFEVFPFLHYRFSPI